MKQVNFLLLFIVLLAFSCNNSSSYYDKIVKHKNEKELINAINKSFDEISKTEDKKAKTKEDFDYLEYEYDFNENGDSYTISYRFDEKGCNEVGVDTYINEIGNANIIVNGFKNYFNADKNFNTPKSDNNLIRWESKDNLMAVELDFRNAEKGMVILTIFAYE